MTQDERIELARKLHDEIGPLLDIPPYGKDGVSDFGYNCCGCSTYRQILAHAERIVLGEP